MLYLDHSRRPLVAVPGGARGQKAQEKETPKPLSTHDLRPFFRYMCVMNFSLGMLYVKSMHFWIFVDSGGLIGF